MCERIRKITLFKRRGKRKIGLFRLEPASSCNDHCAGNHLPFEPDSPLGNLDDATLRAYGNALIAGLDDREIQAVMQEVRASTLQWSWRYLCNADTIKKFLRNAPLRTAESLLEPLCDEGSRLRIPLATGAFVEQCRDETVVLLRIVLHLADLGQITRPDLGDFRV